MKAAIDPKCWLTLVARAARSGVLLLKSEGVAPVVVALDRQGLPHRVDTVDQLEDVLMAAGVPA